MPLGWVRNFRLFRENRLVTGGFSSLKLLNYTPNYGRISILNIVYSRPYCRNLVRNFMTPEDRRTADADQGSIKRMRNAVILPDGTKREPMGSGVITGLLGVGGMANVYEIWNPQLEVNRAVKLLHPNYTEDTKQRFQTEIKITAKLHHPNIIEIHAVGQWNGLL